MGIVGGGVIGAGWARLFRAHGHTVRVADALPERADATLAEAAEGADLVVEAVAEREEAKRAVLREVAAVAPSAALIGSSSSSILPSRLQVGVAHPERVLVLHPLHPVELLPVVEVVPGRLTAPEAVDRAAALLRSLQKTPVVLRRETPGYLVNRLAAALWREAVDLVLSGAADPAQVDLAASRGPCLGWAVQGPFLTYHLGSPEGIGSFLEHLGPAFAAIWENLSGRTRLPAEDVRKLAARVEAAYGGEDRQGLEAQRDRLLAAVLAALEQR